MDSNNKDSNMHEESGNGRKFGLPDWMVHNIERLNTVTDFEQYACSPPEAEGFLSEYVSGPECEDIVDSSVEHNSFEETKKGAGVATPLTPTRISGESKFSPTSYHSILDAIKHEDYYSSPDTTPCATPEPSPAPRRKISGQQDTVQTNPGKWFYLGNSKRIPRQLVKGQCFNPNSDKENKVKSIERTDTVDRQMKDTSAKPGNESIRLVISNFDINAISPTSW